MNRATVYVKELEMFLTMEVLEHTPAVLSLGKLCDEHGCSYEWINGQKPHLIENGIRIQCGHFSQEAYGVLLLLFCTEFVEVIRLANHDISFVFASSNSDTEFCGSGTRVAAFQQ